MRLRHVKIARHRNFGGEPFHCARFMEGNCQMFAVLFEGEGRVAVFDATLLAEGAVEMGVNFFRGDEYEKPLREAIDAWEQARELPSTQYSA